MSWNKAFPKRPSKRSRNIRQMLLSMSASEDDDMPLSVLLGLKGPPRPKKTKKSTPKKAKRAPVAASTPSPAASQVEVVDLVTPERSMMLDTVNSKMGSFLQSAGLISSDEDETDMIKKSKSKSPLPLFISDDSDDDCKLVGRSNFDLSKPSTSTGISTVDTLKDNKPNADDDIMDLVDSVLEGKDANSCEPKQSPLNDLKSLEDFRKETEKMLNEANSLLDEFKTGRSKPEVQEKKEDSPKVTIGSCPICLETLSSRPASVTVCGHIFCKECISQTVKTLKKCPTCRKPLTIKKIHPIYF